MAGQCTFTFTVCAAQTDTGISGCAPGTVNSIKGSNKKIFKAGTLPVTPTSVPLCAASPTTVVIKLKKNGHPNKATLKLTATATGKPKRDIDTLVLKCDPRPSSTPTGAFVGETTD